MEYAFKGRGDFMILTASFSRLTTSAPQHQPPVARMAAIDASHPASRPAPRNEEIHVPASQSTTSRKRKAQNELDDISRKHLKLFDPVSEELKYTPSTSLHASLLGLPAELRLRIYDFVLTPAADNKSNRTPHCCSETRTWASSRLRCTCVGQIPTSILRVNKKIFEEAMPVLYNTTEIRLRLPVCWEQGGVVNDMDVLVQLMRLPQYGREHVRRVLVACPAADISELAPIMTRRFFDKVKTYLPGTRHVPLHVDVAERARRIIPTMPQFNELAAVVTLPKLKTIEIEASGCGLRRGDFSRHKTPRQFRERRELLVATINSKAEGTRVKVIDRIAEIEAHMPKYLEAVESILNQLRNATRSQIPGAERRTEMRKGWLVEIGDHLWNVVGHEGNAKEIKQVIWDYIADLYYPQPPAPKSYVPGWALNRVANPMRLIFDKTS